MKITKYFPLLFTILAGVATATENRSINANVDKDVLDGNIHVTQSGYQQTFNTKNLGKLKTISNFKDAQYSDTASYKGIYLSQLLDRFYTKQTLPYQNTAILVFRNGMRIPIHLSNTRKPEIDPFIAFEVKSKNKKSTWSSSFPSIGKPSELLNDPRPIEFKGNKVAVTSLWHNDAHGPKSQGTANNDIKKLGKKFSPWRHVDSLVEVQIQDKAAYYKAFPKGKSPSLVKGYQTFIQRCQFCHSVNGYGASFGWDFVNPLPIHSKRKPKDLMNHVKYPYHLALERGLMMPTQEDFNLQEAEQLWLWLYFVDKGKEAKEIPK